jgi:hypothetical protein
MMRRALLITIALLCGGCAEMPANYYSPAPLTRLQDPLPGKALVYLFRAPHDEDALSIQITGKPRFELEPSTYTVLTLEPGEHVIEGTTVRSAFSIEKPAFAPTPIKVTADQRAFLYVSGINSSSMKITGLVPVAKGGVMVFGGIMPTTEAGSRSWKECSELDAQGFIDISKLKVVE